MFRHENGLVYPMEVPLPSGLSWVIKIKTDICKKDVDTCWSYTLLLLNTDNTSTYLYSPRMDHTINS